MTDHKAPIWISKKLSWKEFKDYVDTELKARKISEDVRIWRINTLAPGMILIGHDRGGNSITILDY